jgi:hypothetical protein
MRAVERKNGVGSGTHGVSTLQQKRPSGQQQRPSGRAAGGATPTAAAGAAQEGREGREGRDRPSALAAFGGKPAAGRARAVTR